MFIRLCLASSVSLFLLSCVPTITTVYHTPAVAGQVIDATTFQPVNGIQIQHRNPASLRIKTNIMGEFSLPAISSTSSTLLMAGHGLTHYYLEIGEGLNNSEVMVSAPLKMLEVENVSLLIFTAPYSLPFIAGQQVFDLNQDHYEQEANSIGYLQICDQNKVQNALHTLLIARTVIMTSINPPPPLTIEPELSQQYQNAAYQQTFDQWQAIYNSCDGTTEQRKAAKLLIEKVAREARRYLKNG